ncbi:MAG: hypothetical protein NTX89_06060 [Candidatus Omnitrophica bacterium]|nr:hypothetical protein [Candidatus Omnitrophota bacterium]
MNLKKVVVLSGFVIVLISTTGRIAFAEDAAVAPIDQAVITSDQQSTQKETDMQWAWGEVTNLDHQANTVTLKYLDYETDQEKDLVLVVDEKTTFENIKDFNELKLKDTLSIDYMVGANNKNIAKNISFEKPDVSSPVPDLAQPTAQSEIPVDASIAANEVLAPPAPAAPQEPVPAVQDQAQ